MNDREMAKIIAEKVAQQGGKTYFVGGCVRDTILGKENKDIDIEAHGIIPYDLKHILSSCGELTEHGSSFGVYGLKGYDLDVAMPRTELRTGEKHTDFEVDVDPFIGEIEASRRRDFTINALMQDVLTGEVLDFWNGKSDLEKKLIRHVDSKTFSEDALRVLRAAQFAARFDFKIASETIDLCKNTNISIAFLSLSKERVFGEMEKALLKSENPSIFFDELGEIIPIHVWFSELYELMGVPQNEVHHQEGDVWTHTLMVLDEAAKKRKEAEYPLGLMLSALCHDFGKAVCSFRGEDGLTHAYEHETKGVPLAKTFLERLTNEKELTKYVLNMVELHQEPNQKADANSRIKSTNKMFDKAISPKDLVLLSICDDLGRIPSSEKNKSFLFDRLKIYHEMMSRPFVQGRDLVAAGLKPDKSFTDILGYAHKLRLAGIEKADALKQTLSYQKVCSKSKNIV